MDEIEAGIRDAMAAVLGIPVDEIGDETSPDTVPAWDSLQQINLILALQDAFGVVFEPDEIMEMLSYAVIVREVRRKLA